MKASKSTIATTIAFIMLSSHSLGQDTLDPNAVLGDPRNVIRADDIPAGEQGRYFIPGASVVGGNFPVSSYAKTFKMGAGFNVNLNRGCGELNPFKNMGAQLKGNIRQKVEEFKAFIQTVPTMIASSAVEYALAKINPDLYQLTQLNIDEYMELFQINVKTCEQVRREVSNNPNANPFDAIMQIAIADQWKTTIGTEGAGGFENSHEIKQKIAKRAQENGMVLADGKRYGGKDQPPIDFIKSMATAGINIMVGRSNTSEWAGKFSATEQEQNPIARHFNSAEEMVKFIEDIYGLREVRLNNGPEGAVNSSPGVGMGRIFTELQLKNLKAINEYLMRKISREEFFKQTNILVAPIVMDDMRLADEYQRVAEAEAMAKDEAIKQLKTKLYLVADAIKAGSNAPEMVQSSMSQIADKEMADLYYKILDDIKKLDNLRY